MNPLSRKYRFLLFVASLSMLLSGCFTGGYVMMNYSLTPKNRGKDIEGSYRFMYERYDFLQAWVDSLNQAEALRDTTIVNPEGIPLHALYIEAAQPTPRTAVIVHGYTDNAIRMLMIGYLYNKDLGYNVLLPDLQYHGLSGGNSIQMGWKDRYDVLQWVEVADGIFGGETEMVLHGISMGAATIMMLSGEPLPDYVRCFVEDCGYTSVWDEFSNELRSSFFLPPFPLMYTTNWFCQRKYGWNFKEASSLNQVRNCTLPMFFIHGDADKFVPTWMVFPLYEAKPEPKEIWLTPGSKHALSYRDHKEEYTERVRQFLDFYMP